MNSVKMTNKIECLDKGKPFEQIKPVYDMGLWRITHDVYAAIFAEVLKNHSLFAWFFGYYR